MEKLRPREGQCLVQGRRDYILLVSAVALAIFPAQPHIPAELGLWVDRQGVSWAEGMERGWSGGRVSIGIASLVEGRTRSLNKS